MTKHICINCFKKSLILWDNNKKASCSSCNITFTKEELINKLKEINKRRIEVIDYGLPDPMFTPGWISRTNEQVKCPLCGHIFIQHVESGCFGSSRLPMFCPKCGFFNSTITLKWELEKL